MKNNKILTLLLAICTLSLLTESCKDSEDVIDLCANVICENGGTCDNGTCDCPDGFTGTNCETTDLCFGIVCENGGTCVAGNCDCPDGYIGINCETIDSCFGINCGDGGSCIDGNCDCLDGYFGEFCENQTIQHQLNEGLTPMQLFENNVPLDSIYGKLYQGGLITYLNTDLGTGLLATTEDISSFSQWGCSGTEISGADGTELGTGMQNTIDILMGCSESGIAARICADLEFDGNSDWFLPSLDELVLLFNNLHANGHGGFNSDVYFSSTELDSNRIWGYDFFGGGDEVTGQKFAFGAVRPVRTF